jgi:hypothetical protein
MVLHPRGGVVVEKKIHAVLKGKEIVVFRSSHGLGELKA